MKRLLAGLALCLLSSVAHAQVPQAVAGTTLGPWIDLGDCQLTSVSASTQLSACTGGIPANTQYAIVQFEGGTIRWRGDGTAPTASVGMPVAAGTQLYWTISLISSLKFIPETGSVTVDIAFIGIK